MSMEMKLQVICPFCGKGREATFWIEWDSKKGEGSGAVICTCLRNGEAGCGREFLAVPKVDLKVDVKTGRVPKYDDLESNPQF